MLSVAEKLAALRAEMQKENIDMYFIPTDDFHGSEYVCEYFKCREYMSGFTGSAGKMLVGPDFAGLWTDGRYFIQAADQLKETEIALMKMGEPGVLSLEDYLVEHLDTNSRLGFDGRCVSAEFVNNLEESFSNVNKSIEIVGDIDLVDRIWSDRPTITFHPVWKLTDKQSGESFSEKLEKIWNEIEKSGATAFLLTSLEDIAWLLNLRGSDVHCNPVFLSYLYISKNQLILFANQNAFENFDSYDLKHMQLMPYEEIYNFVKELTEETILLDDKVVNFRLVNQLKKQNTVISKVNPSTALKAVKNKTELQNTREAHIYDGVAVTKFLFFLKNYRDAVLNGVWTDPLLTEMQLAKILLGFRKEHPSFIEESFDPIMAYGSNGAIVHYSATKETDTEIGTDSFLLSDTGGHYKIGTTDITRTISLARAEDLPDEMKKHYTLVLKSHLNLLDAKFPKGVTGNSLDAIAREPLWKEGLDFNHGTGHGVGYILSVHEGPNAFRTYRGRGKTDTTSIVPGMITSDEPGLYFEGKYGIRIESLIECVEEENGFYGFRPLTYVPFDMDAIDFDLLSESEKRVLNIYHEMVYLKIGKLLKKEEQEWLYQTTRPIK